MSGDLEIGHLGILHSGISTMEVTGTKGGRSSSQQWQGSQLSLGLARVGSSGGGIPPEKAAQWQTAFVGVKATTPCQ